MTIDIPCDAEPSPPSSTRDASRWAPLAGGRIASLDGLRAISILLVIGLHWINAVTRPRTGADYDGPWLMLLNGDLGVSVFFVISGFLITHLLLREHDRTGTLDLKAFYVRRSFRIWPAYFTFLGVVAALQVLHVFWVGIGNLLAAATFTFNYAPHVGSWWVGHSWSLSVEEQFYLAWPLAVRLLDRRHVGRVAIALILAAPLVRLAEVVCLPDANIFVLRLSRMVHTRLDGLMFGCAAALFYGRPTFQRFVAAAERWGVTALAVAYLIASPELERRCPWLLRAALAFTLQGACISLVLVWAIRHVDGPVGRFLNWRPVVHVGHISFSLYLWQQLFFVSLNTSWTGRFPANLLLAFALAELSFFAIEQPFLRLRDRVTGHRRNPRPAAATADPALPRDGTPPRPSPVPMSAIDRQNGPRHPARV